MERNIEEAVKLYSGDKPIGLFVQKLGDNLTRSNELYRDIAKVFANAGVPDFTKNPEDKTACGKFASLFRNFNDCLEAAKIQGFKWEQREYVFQEKPGARNNVQENNMLTNGPSQQVDTLGRPCLSA
jgi:type I restriction enzyme R subunit